MELMKLMVAQGAAETLSVMADSGLLGQVLGGAPLLGPMRGLVAREAALGLDPDPVRRLGALAVSVVEDAERLWQRLRLSNAEHERLTAMADGWWRVAPDADQQAARRLLYGIGPEKFTDRVMLAWTRARAATDDAAWRALVALPAHWTVPQFPLRAADFISRGVEKGPRLGEALSAAEQSWIAAGFPRDRAALEQIADEIAATAKA
jgi:poly(A) polymerase